MSRYDVSKGFHVYPISKNIWFLSGDSPSGKSYFIDKIKNNNIRVYDVGTFLEMKKFLNEKIKIINNYSFVFIFNDILVLEKSMAFLKKQLRELAGVKKWVKY